MQSLCRFRCQCTKCCPSLGQTFEGYCYRSIEEFIPLLRVRMSVLNPYVRQFLLGWITVLDSVPEFDMLGFLPDFIDGLFNMLGNLSHELRQADSALLEFLQEIKNSPEKDLRRLQEEPERDEKRREKEESAIQKPAQKEARGIRETCVSISLIPPTKFIFCLLILTKPKAVSLFIFIALLKIRLQKQAAEKIQRGGKRKRD